MARTSKKNLHDAEENPPEQQSLGVEPENIAEIEEPTAPAPQSEPEEPNPADPVIEGEPAKRRPGRPSRTDPPVMRSAIIERINNLLSWEGTRVYVYRWEPFTDRKAGGKQSVMVKRYDGPFDEQDILEDPGMGSGVYELVVNRTDPQTRQRKIIDSGIVRLLNMKYPPRIPQKEWVDDERNKDWEWARNLSEKMEAPTAAAPQSDPLVGLLQSTISAQREDLRELRQEMRAAAAPKKDTGEATLLSVLAPAIPALLQRLLEPPKADPTQALFMQYLMNQADKKSEPPPPAPPPKDPADELTRIIELKNKMEESFGGNHQSRSRKSGTQEMITDVAAAFAPALQTITQVVAMGMARKAQEDQAAAQRQQQQGQQPQQQHNEPAPLELLPADAPTPGAGPKLVKKPSAQQLAEAVLDHLKKNETGLDLGDWFLEKWGEKEFTEIRVQGKPKLISDMQSAPNVWRFLAEYQENGQLDAMLTDFLTWEPADDDEDDDDEPPADAATAAIKDGWTAPVNQEVRP